MVSMKMRHKVNYRHLEIKVNIKVNHPTRLLTTKLVVMQHETFTVTEVNENVNSRPNPHWHNSN